jgi:hypothetical protein
MGIIDGLLSGFLGPLGKKAAQWLPSKEGLMRRKIADYEKQLKELQAGKWDAHASFEHNRINELLRQERVNLDTYLSTNS